VRGGGGEVGSAHPLRSRGGGGRGVAAPPRHNRGGRREERGGRGGRMSLWGGQRTARGVSLAEAQREFYLRYNVAVGAAQLLNRADALALTERIKL